MLSTQTVKTHSATKTVARAKMYTLRMARIAIFVALITVGAFIKIPIGIVPVAMQFAFAMLAGLMLGAKDGLIAVIIYIAMGLFGLPIFTAGGGFQYVFQPTFGYMLGYIVAVPVCGIIARGFKKDAPLKLSRLMIGAFTAMAIVYFVGVMYMYFILNVYLGTGIAMGKAWITGCAVFIPTDSMWCVVGSIIAFKTLPYINKAL